MSLCNSLTSRIHRRNRRVLSAVLALMACAVWCAKAPAAAEPLAKKKLIEYGWDVPTPEYVRDHIREMEQRPFSGLMFFVPDFNNALDTREWNPSQLRPHLDALKAIRWNQFTDNFLVLQSANKWNLDWFDDAQWETVLSHIRMVSHMAKVGRCVGVVLDPEPYGPNPWSYQIVGKGHTYAETAAMLRKRGGEFMRALRSEMPNLQLLSFYGISTFRDIAQMTNSAERDKIFASPIRRARWALLASFINGWLDGSSPRTAIYDGHEGSYGFRTDEQYFWDYYLIKEGVLPIIAPENRAIYKQRVHPSAALYMDELLGLFKPKDAPVTVGLTYPDRLLWLEHNTYISLLTSDVYVWCYSERMNWWQNKVPDGAEEAIRRAEDKVAKGEQLGFSIKEVMTRWKQAEPDHK